MNTLELAKLLGGILHGEEAREIHEVAALGTAGPNELTYAEGSKSLELAAASQAGCILVPEECILAGRTTIGIANPKLAFVRAAEDPLSPPQGPAGSASHGCYCSGRPLGRGRDHSSLRGG